MRRISSKALVALVLVAGLLATASGSTGAATTAQNTAEGEGQNGWAGSMQGTAEFTVEDVGTEPGIDCTVRVDSRVPDVHLALAGGGAVDDYRAGFGTRFEVQVEAECTGAVLYPSLCTLAWGATASRAYDSAPGGPYVEARLWTGTPYADAGEIDLALAQDEVGEGSISSSPAPCGRAAVQEDLRNFVVDASETYFEIDIPDTSPELCGSAAANDPGLAVYLPSGATLQSAAFEWSLGFGGAGGQPCADVPAMYAPEVRLHPDEDFFPMGTAEFVDASALRWAVNNGGDEDVAASGAINEAWLGSGGYEVQGWQSDQLTAPGVGEGRPSGLSDAEGFYLDLDDSARVGAEPVGGAVHAPMSYDYEPGEYVTYWFMYGYNPGADVEYLPADGQLIDRHEGEWERITIALDTYDQPVAAYYFVHTCDSTPIRVPWYLMTDGVEENGEITDGTHPVVYSALGSHASFPNLVDIGREGLCPLVPGVAGQGWGDVTADGGATWRGWQVDLRDAEDQDWYGFGGAWGETAGALDYANPQAATHNGPLGPPHKGISGLPDTEFRDVPGSHQFWRDIRWMVQAGVATGYRDNTFRPNGAVTRAGMAAFLYRLAGRPAFDPGSADTGFTDVSTSHPFALEIVWMAYREITTGYRDGSFRPNDPVRRAAMAAFLYRFAGEPPFTPAAGHRFTDVARTHTFFKQIEWMKAEGISTGTNGRYEPNKVVTRAAMSAFVHRLAEGPLLDT